MYNLTNWLINHDSSCSSIAAVRRMGSRGQPEESRAAILQAAAQEFAEHGIAGARTDAIARAARVNKALLYYYFKDKETLYGAVLDDAFSGMKATFSGCSTATCRRGKRFWPTWERISISSPPTRFIPS